MDVARLHLQKGPATKKKCQKKASEEVLETARYQISGPVPYDVVISEEKGYLFWLNPYGACDVVFKYKDTSYSFSLYFDPQFPGMEIYEILGERKRLIYNGYDDLDTIRDDIRRKDKTFRVLSEDGFVRLRLYLLDDWKKLCHGLHAVKINYTMIIR